MCFVWESKREVNGGSDEIMNSEKLKNCISYVLNRR
jgi:hypothetical protein